VLDGGGSRYENFKVREKMELPVVVELEWPKV
jgi:hypothetical protein